MIVVGARTFDDKERNVYPSRERSLSLENIRHTHTQSEYNQFQLKGMWHCDFFACDRKAHSLSEEG